MGVNCTASPRIERGESARSSGMRGTGALVMVLMLVAALAGIVGCGKDDLANYSLGTETYNQNALDCKQLYFKGKAVPQVFLKKIHKASGSRVEGVACHDKTVVVNAENSA